MVWIHSPPSISKVRPALTHQPLELKHSLYDGINDTSQKEVTGNRVFVPAHWQSCHAPMLSPHAAVIYSLCFSLKTTIEPLSTNFTQYSHIIDFPATDGVPWHLMTGFFVK